MDAVAKTSLLTAAMRAAESLRSESEGRLFFDPYAEMLAGEEGKELRQRAISESGDQPAIAVRTHFMDQKILEGVGAGVRQIIILAAGMDTRAYLLPFPKDTKVLELDQQEVLDYKNEKLKGFEPKCLLTRVAVDLRMDWQKQLTQNGFDRHADRKFKASF